MAEDSGALVHCAGIQFPATQAANAGANVLDDYEEGDWTPTLTDGTDTSPAVAGDGGHYTKIGRMVCCTGRLVTDDLTDSSTGNEVNGNLRIGGLPFAIKNSYGGYFAVTAGHSGGLNITAGESIVLQAEVGQQYMQVLVWNATTGTANMDASEWTDDGSLSFTFSYFV